MKQFNTRFVAFVQCWSNDRTSNTASLEKDLIKQDTLPSNVSFLSCQRSALDVFLSVLFGYSKKKKPTPTFHNLVPFIAVLRLPDHYHHRKTITITVIIITLFICNGCSTPIPEYFPKLILSLFRPCPHGGCLLQRPQPCHEHEGRVFLHQPLCRVEPPSIA